MDRDYAPVTVKGYYWYSADHYERYGSKALSEIPSPNGKAFTCVTSDQAGAGYKWPDKELIPAALRY